MSHVRLSLTCHPRSAAAAVLIPGEEAQAVGGVGRKAWCQLRQIPGSGKVVEVRPLFIGLSNITEILGSRDFYFFF